MRWTCTTLLLCLSLTVARAQLTLRINAIDASRFPAMTIKARILDANIRVPNLDRSDLELRENGIVQTADISCPANGVSIMLVLDKSTSMAFFPNTRIKDPDSARWRNAKGALMQFIDNMATLDEAGFISFHGSIDLDQDFTTDKTLLKDAIYGVQLGPYTAIWAAVDFAIDLLSPRPTRRAIVLLTDGEDNFSDPVTLPFVIGKARQNDVRIFTVGLGEDIGRAGLDSLAALTGGKFYYSAIGEDLAEIYRQIVQEIGEDCTITYDATNICPDGTRREIELTVRRNGMTATQDTFYFAPRDLALFSVSLMPNQVVAAGGVVRMPVRLDHAVPMYSPLEYSLRIGFDTALVRFSGVETKGTLSENGSIRTQTGGGSATIDVRSAGVPDSGTTLIHLLFTAARLDESRNVPLAMSFNRFLLRCEPQLVTSGGSILLNGTCNRIASVKKNRLLQNAPNPFNPTTTIRYESSARQEAELGVYNPLGQEVQRRRWIAGEGVGEITFDAGGLPSGVYLYRLRLGEWSEARRMVVAK